MTERLHLPVAFTVLVVVVVVVLAVLVLRATLVEFIPGYKHG